MSLETANTAAELVDYWRHLARDTQRELSAERRKHAEQIAMRDARILALETQCDKLPSRESNEVPMTMHDDPTQWGARRLAEFRERAMSAEETVRRQRRDHVNELATRDARILALEHERDELRVRMEPLSAAPPPEPVKLDGASRRRPRFDVEDLDEIARGLAKRIAASPSG